MPAISSTSCRSVSASACESPWIAAAKNGSATIRSSGSGTTNATAFVRCVTRVRAARLGVKPSRRTAASTAARARGLTLASPLMARDAVDLDTPAAVATSSRVGAPRRVPISSAGPPLAPCMVAQ